MNFVTLSVTNEIRFVVIFVDALDQMLQVLVREVTSTRSS